MKHLFLIRHGDDFQGKLSYLGCEQMRILGESINKILQGETSYILSSEIPRALDSASILQELLHSEEVEEVPYIGGGGNNRKNCFEWEFDFNKVEKIVDMRRNNAKGLILVTHSTEVEKFSSHFLKKELGINNYPGGIPKGHAYHLDLLKKSYHVLP